MAEVKRRSTWQRSAIMDLLERSQVFLSAQQIHAELEEEGTKVGLATVYRNLQSLAEEDLVDTVRSDDGEALYRLCTNEGHHHHTNRPKPPVPSGAAPAILVLPEGTCF